MLYVFPAGTVQTFMIGWYYVTFYPDYGRLVTQTLLLIAMSTRQIRLPTALKESQSSKMLNYTILLKKTTQQSSLPSTIMRALMKIPLFAFQSLKHILIG